MDSLKERFLKYIAIDTKSDPKSKTVPTTEKQKNLGKVLVDELLEMGLTDAHMDEKGYVYATLKGDENFKTIGLIAHMDTSPDLDGKCENPKTVNYSGGDIVLSDEYSIKVSEFPFLKNLVGEELITTDGTTLLGADDKAGISIIMETVKYYKENPDIKRGTIKVGFTPDEEVGRGADYFDVEKFGADFAYTIDGGPIGGLEYENFNAASAHVEIKGKNVHPGSSKTVMLNSQRIAMELEGLLPVDEKPEYTEGYEGFFHLTNFEGTVEKTTMEYIIRDHSKEKFEEKKKLMEEIAEFLNKKYGNVIDLTIKDSYYNMKEMIKPHMEIIELAKKSFEEAGVTVVTNPIRGGTDGARLSYMGLPCPNIFTGGYNYHGRYEFISYDQMKKSLECVKNIIKNNAK